MDTNKPSQISKSNHKRQSFWQIWFPLAVTILVFILIAVLIILATSHQGSMHDFSVKWSSISLIYMIIPALLVCFVFLAILVAIIYGISQLIIYVPQWAAVALYYLNIAAETIRNFSDKSVIPIFKAHQFFASFKTFRKRLGL